MKTRVVFRSCLFIVVVFFSSLRILKMSPLLFICFFLGGIPESLESLVFACLVVVSCFFHIGFLRFRKVLTIIAFLCHVRFPLWILSILGSLRIRLCDLACSLPVVGSSGFLRFLESVCSLFVYWFFLISQNRYVARSCFVFNLCWNS